MTLDAADVKARLNETGVHAILQRLGVPKFSTYGSENWLVSAPYREDKDPSLSIHRSNGLWNDKATNDRGDIYDLVMKTTSCTLPEAVQLVAETAGIVVPNGKSAGPSPVVASYDYVDKDGQLLYTVKRTANKQFYPVQPNGRGKGYGPRRGLYHLDEVVTSGDRWVLVVEGEKDADRLRSLGFIATTSPGGANGWNAGRNETGVNAYAPSLRGRSVAIIPDNDLPGWNYAMTAARSIYQDLGGPIASEVKIIVLPDLGLRQKNHGKDVSDWLDAEHTADELKELILNAQPFGADPHSVEDASDTGPEIGYFGPSLIIRALASYETQPVDWLWHRWLARKKAIIYAGVEGDGKSYSLTDIVARLTTGEVMPDGFHPPICNVLMLIAEDGIEDTVRPRLERHNANIDRVLILAAVRQEDERETMFSLSQHLPLLEDAIAKHEIDVIVIDPLSSFLQRADRNDEGAVRDLLTPLTMLADRTDVAVIGVAHLNRPNGTNRRATQRILGSTAFGAVARLVWMIAPADDPDDPSLRVLGVVKSNLSLKPASLAWSIPEEDAAIVWYGESDESIEMLLDGHGKRRGGSSISPERQDIIDVLEDAGDGMSPTEIAAALQKSVSTTRNLLRHMEEDGQVERPRTGIYAVLKHRFIDSVDSVDATNHKASEESMESMESTNLWHRDFVDSAAEPEQAKQRAWCDGPLDDDRDRLCWTCVADTVDEVP